MNAPELDLGLELFYLVFCDLTTSRVLGGSGPGPIPWFAIQSYCQASAIEGEQREDVFYHVQHLDKIYLDWLGAKRQRELKAATPPRSAKR